MTESEQDSTDTLTVLVADDHWVSRTGMRHLLVELDAGVVLREAADFEEAVAVLKQDPAINLIILDLLMPGMDAFDGLTAIRMAAPNVPLVVMSMLEDRRHALRAIELGAMGYIPKTGNPSDTLKAIRQILDGDIYLPQRLMRTEGGTARSGLGAGQSRPEMEARLGDLTRRQRDVFWLLGHGKSNIEIATDLGISEFTARQHVSAVLRKLDFNNRTQAALLASQVRGSNP